MQTKLDPGPPPAAGTQFVRFTEHTLSKLPTPPDGQRVVYRDEKAPPGLILRVGATAKTWQVVRKVNGKVVRATLGRWPAMSCGIASKEASKVNGKLTAGRNVNVEKKAAQASSITLGEVFDLYLDAKRSKPDDQAMKASTEADYRREFRNSFTKQDGKPVYADWAGKPIRSITEADLRKWYRARSKASPARANNAVRILTAVFNYASRQFKLPNSARLVTLDIGEVLGDYSVEVKARTRYVTPNDMPAWWAALERLALRGDAGATCRDLFKFAALVGCRISEARLLRWDDVNIDAATVSFPDTKNRRSPVLPIGDYLVRMLNTRRRYRPEKNPFVFWGEQDSQPIVGITKVRLAHITDCEVEWSPHDLRRGVATAGRRIGIDRHIVKSLLNHKDADITEAYTQAEVEALRPHAEILQRHILAIAKAASPGAENVVTLRNGAGAA